MNLIDFGRLAGIVLAGLALAADAATGDLDPTFASRGMYNPGPVCCGTAGASAVALQADGKVLAAGFAQNGAIYEAVIVRATASGTADTTFGSGGVVRFSFGSATTEVRTLAVLADGRIVGAGAHGSEQAWHGFVFRLDATGKADSTFGRGGTRLVGPLVGGSTRTSLRRVIPQSDGKLVLAGGLTLASGDVDMFVMRLDAAGALDASFGNGGMTLSRVVERDEAFDVVLAADGSIYAVGTAIVAGTTYGALMRVLPNGMLDPGFDNDGVKAPIIGFPHDPRAIAVQSDGRLLIGGRLNTSAAVMRLHPDGTLDASYGSGGARTFGGNVITRLAMLTGDRTVALLENSPFSPMTVQRLNADGSLDSSWLANGTAVNSGQWRDGRGADMAVSGGSVLVATSDVSNSILGVVKLVDPGRRDASFGTNGEFRLSPGLAPQTGDYLNVALTANGSILVRHVVNFAQTLVTQLTPYGRVDTAFGSAGHVTASFTTQGALVVKPDGRIMLTDSNGNRVVQLQANGATDTSFTSPSIGGSASPYLVPYSDGRFLLGNSSRLGRFLASGAIDPTFNFGQVLSLPSPFAWTAATVVEGGGFFTGGTRQSTAAFVEKHDAGGAMDFAFGSAGRADIIVGTEFTGVSFIALQGDGKVVVTGNARNVGSGALHPYVARLLPNGTLDASFASGGILRVAPFGTSPIVRGLAIDTAGAILITGTEGSSSTTFRGFVWRFNPDGAPDLTFGTNGLKLIDTSPGSEGSNAIALQPNGGIILAGSSNGTPAVWRLFGSSTGPGGPIASLVASYYRTILGRDPDGAGQSFWEGELARITSLGASASETFYVMAAAFFGSAEYAQRATSDRQFATDLYRTFFTREPDSAGLDFWLGQLAAGRPREAVLNEFLFSTEFSGFMTSMFGAANLSRAEIGLVMDFYRGLLHRLPDSSGFSFWVGRVRSAQCSGSVAFEADAMSSLFLASSEYSNRQAALPTQQARNAAFVLDLYSAFLRRGAEAEGFRFFTQQLDSGAQTPEQLRRQFVSSPEFQARVQAVQSQGCNR